MPSRSVPILLALGWALLLAYPPRAGAQFRAAALFDASGSMAGFYSTGALVGLDAALRRAGSQRSFVFLHEEHPGTPLSGAIRPFGEPLSRFGNVTLLWRALSDYRRQEPGDQVLVMVTDNIQDAGALPHEARDIRDFYARLAAEEAFPVVYVLPLRLAFEGHLYGRDGRTRIVPPYHGRRGLVMYVIGVGAASADATSRLARALAAETGAPAVRMKPYNRAPIRAVVDTSAQSRGASRSACADETLKPDPDEPGVLVRERPVVEGRRFGGAFTVLLRSEMEGVALSQPYVSGEVREAFALQDVEVSGQPLVSSTPPRLTTLLEPGDATSVLVQVCFPDGLQFLGPRRRFILFNRAEGTYEGTVRLQLRAAQSDLLLTETIRREFSVVDEAFFTVADSSLHRRVFKLEHAFRALAPATVTVETPIDYRLRFTVRYPLSPLLGFLLKVGLALALLAGLGFLLAGRGRYLLRHEGGGRFHLTPQRRERPAQPNQSDVPDLPRGAGPPTGGFAENATVVHLVPWSAYPVRDVDRTVATLRRFPFRAPIVKAAPGYVLEDGAHRLVLDKRGSSFQVVEAPGEGAGDSATSIKSRRSPSPSTGRLDPF